MPLPSTAEVMGDHSAFFYGTLMAPAVLYRVCYGTSQPSEFQKSLLSIRPALLSGFQRHKVKHADYPAIIPCPQNENASEEPCVRGTFVSGLTDGDIWRLDIFEGDEYERKDVKVALLDDDDSPSKTKEEAQTYVWIAGEDQLEQGEWDFDEFVREKITRWVGNAGEPEYAGRQSIRGSSGFALEGGAVTLDGVNADELATSAEVDDAVKANDPTRGRGLNGSISKKLENGDDGNKKEEALESAV